MADAPLSPEEIAHRGFASSFRGFDTNEVRDYLARVAEELRAAAHDNHELQLRLVDAEHRAAHPVLDHATLSRAVGDEMARVLASAQEAGQELRAKAEENVGRMLREAHEHAQRIRAEADAVLAARSAETQEAVAQVQAQAQAEAEAITQQARDDAAVVAADEEARSRRLVQEAEAARAQVLGDLSRRRRMINVQVEQLRAGRDRLLDAYRVVRRTLDEVSDELERVEDEAKAAASEAARRLALPADAEAGTRSDATVPVRIDDDVQETDGVRAPGDGETDTPLPATAPVPSPVPSPLPPARSPSPFPLARPGPSLARADPTPEPVTDRLTEPAVKPAAEPPPSVVEDLFARIRADREASVARAEEVLAATGPLAAMAVEETPLEASPREGRVEERAAADASAANGKDDEVLRERRDAVAEPIWTRLTRALKRALQDEQNEALDRLRGANASGVTSAGLVPNDRQLARYTKAATPLIEEAVQAGIEFVDTGASPGGPSVRVADLVSELAESLAEPLRRAVDDGVRASGDDLGALVERIGGVYREWRGQRVERLAVDATVGAFGRGTLAGAGGQALRWIVEDQAGGCSDCDDNALAGPTIPGDTYPTGQTHPPAHGGCRCFLVPAP